MANIAKIVGIDFGTTFSVTALVENETPIIIPNKEGTHKTPSVVVYHEDGKTLVGEIARRRGVSNPQRTVYSVKRIMGRDFYNLAEGDQTRFKIVNDEGSILLDVGDRQVSPTEVASEIFKYLKEAIQIYFDEEVSKAVVTVPAYFDERQREATKEAAQLAGLEVVRLVNEPTAAAMAYGLGRETCELVAVYDFGGGTFDLSILDIEEKAFEVIATHGDSHLGGDDIDRAIANILIAEFNETHKIDLHEDPLAIHRLLEAAEKAKCELSTMDQTVISLPFIAYSDEKPFHIEREFKREELENLLEPLIARTITCCGQALNDAKLKPAEISRVILVGGSTRIPAVQNAVEQFFGKPAHKVINPEEIVAMGAAVQAAVLEGALREVVLMDITPHSLGVETAGDNVSCLIEKNSTIPVKATKLFTTSNDDQTFVNIHVLQGEAERASENWSLGRFILSDIPPRPAGVARIRVTFSLNADGILEVSAVELSSGKEKKLTLVHQDLLEAEKIARQKRRERPVIREPREPKKEVVEEEILQSSDVHAQETFAIIKDEPKPSIFDEEEFVKTSLSDTQAEIAPELKQGLTLVNEGKDDASSLEQYEKLAPQLLQLMESHPEEAWGYFFLTKAYLLLHQPDKAFEVVNSYLSIKSYNEQLALSLLGQIIMTFPEFIEPRLERAELYLKSEQIENAINELEPVLESSEDQRVGEKLLELYQRQQEKGFDTEFAFKIVKVYLKLHQLDEAIEILQELAQVEACRGRALKILGLCLWQKDMLYFAWHKFKVLPIGEEIKDILYRLATDMESRGQFEYALEVLEHIANHDPEFRDVQKRASQLRQKRRITEVPMGMETSEILGQRFEILEEINRGSMGIIYKAKDRVLDEVVAIKLLNEYLCTDKQAVARFKGEARAAKKLSHPYIVRIHDLYETPKRLFISMEYIRGIDLKRLLAKGEKPSLGKIFHYLSQICDALIYAHKLKVVHRDIKPANIMIDPQDNIKVTDFGIAKILSAEAVTQAGTSIVGTPLYMSPEQIMGGKVDPRSDIYSLGVVLYELLAGQPPFVHGSIEYHHLHTAPPSLPETIAAPIRTLVFKCIEKKPKSRFQSVTELIQFLNTLNDEETKQP